MPETPLKRHASHPSETLLGHRGMSTKFLSRDRTPRKDHAKIESTNVRARELW